MPAAGVSNLVLRWMSVHPPRYHDARKISVPAADACSRVSQATPEESLGGATCRRRA